MENLPEKARSRIELNSDLLQVALGAFFLIITLKAELLNSIPLLIQLVSSIPLLLTSIMAYSKVCCGNNPKKWNTLGWITFIMAYAFIMNSIGILIGIMIGTRISLLFFAISCLLPVIYSFIEVSNNGRNWKDRVVKDCLFISLQLLFGALVVIVGA